VFALKAMLFAYQKIAEQRIADAQKKGEFDHLEGKGKPLCLDGANVPEDLKLAYKMLKNAGFVPPELELQKQIRQTEDLLACLQDEKDKYKAMKKLNFLVLKLNVMRGARADMEIPQRYEPALIGRLEKKQD
jgi:hypothetical protein